MLDRLAVNVPPLAPAVRMPHRPMAAGASARWTAAALVALAIAAPVEVPLARVPGLPVEVTSLELVLLALLALAAARGRAAVAWRAPVVVPGLVLVGVCLVSAIAAPAHAGNALKFTGRLLVAGLLMLVAARAFADVRLRLRVVAAMLAAGVVVAVVAVLEAAEVPAVLSALTAFRPGFHVVGGQIRATSMLAYPTIASMYLEVVFALGLVFLAQPDAPARRRRTALAAAALVIVAAGVVATFTRAGLITMGLSLLIVAALLAARTRGLDRRHAWLGLVAACLVGLVLLSRSPELLAARFAAQGSADMYGAEYEVPASLRMAPGGRYDVPVTVTNRGRLTWRSDDHPPFAMSYHWVLAGNGGLVQFNGARTAFPGPVPPGRAVRLAATVAAPGYPGEYELVWDVVHEHRAWLSTEGVRPGRSRVRVEGAPVAARPVTQGRLPQAVERTPRPALWRAALALAADRPLLGVGPDNFRLQYGAALGLAEWDRRVHANNTYLELLAGAGLAGLAAFAWVGVVLVRTAWRRWRHATPTELPLAAAALAALAAMAVHGLVDSFLAFTTTYVTFALAAGLASPGPEGIEDDADRV